MCRGYRDNGTKCIQLQKARVFDELCSCRVDEDKYVTLYIWGSTFDF